jgi:hypothetical protein
LPPPVLTGFLDPDSDHEVEMNCFLVFVDAHMPELPVREMGHQEIKTTLLNADIRPRSMRTSACSGWRGRLHGKQRKRWRGGGA